MRITRIDWARLTGQRPRAAGCNARLGTHGQTVSPGVARVWTDDGATGWGWSRIERDAAEPLLGAELADAVALPADASAPRGIPPALREIEYPLLDLLARREGLPVYRWLAGATAPPEEPLSVPCYDTSLYFDDLHLTRDDAAAACMVDEMRAGWERGHRAFKLKVGRGAMHMPLEEGTRRDIAIVRAVRDAAGPDARLMCDANNGYNLNLLKRVLSETADANLYWIEEPFHEDGTLYAHLKAWMQAEGLRVLIADGEGDASPRLLDWACDGLIDVVQHDILRPGFSH
jgi:L-rhamnonate dehydratase